jgi:hypothetical protein
VEAVVARIEDNNKELRIQPVKSAVLFMGSALYSSKSEFMIVLKDMRPFMLAL